MTVTGSRLRVCLIARDVYGWGRYGAAGRAARLLGRALARHGVRTTAIVPLRRGQRDVEHVDGITVLGYPPNALRRAAELCRECDAQVYHSHDPSMTTALAMAVHRRSAHVITVHHAAETAVDRLAELRAPAGGRARALGDWVRDGNPVVWLAVRHAAAVACAANDLVSVVRTKYHLRAPGPEVLPTPVDVPRRVQKARTPVVCFFGAWERRHRPESFFELAPRFPRITFVAIGRPLDRAYDAALRREYADLPNVRMPGFVSRFRSDAIPQILSESWVLVTVGVRRGLPDACVEAAAHRCAILGADDPDGFASRFGHHAANGDLAAGLDALLTGDAWRERGERGYEHVRETFEVECATARHLAFYDAVLSR